MPVNNAMLIAKLLADIPDQRQQDRDTGMQWLSDELAMRKRALIPLWHPEQYFLKQDMENAIIPPRSNAERGT